MPKENEFLIEGFQRRFNIAGHGKGLVTFYRVGFHLVEQVTKKVYQMTKVRSNDYDIIHIYRSSNVSAPSFVRDLYNMIDKSKETFIVGDFNICFLSEGHHPVIRFLLSQGFKQLVKRPTHIEGRLIDHIYHLRPSSNSDFARFTVNQQSCYFTDHDVLSLVQVK